MTVIADTNVLVRAITGDHPHQSAVAQAELARAERVAIPLMALCELVWVLAKGYGIGAVDIGDTIRRIIEAGNVLVDRPAVEAGLALLAAGGDFADGAIAYEGKWLGGEEFISFDRQAVKLLAAGGNAVRLLA